MRPRVTEVMRCGTTKHLLTLSLRLLQHLSLQFPRVLPLAPIQWLTWALSAWLCGS